MDKNRRFKLLKGILCTLLGVTAVLVLFILSPLHPQNISDRTVAEKGAEYTVKLKGISDYSENGFTVVTDRFSFVKGKLFVYEGEDGFAYTSDDGNGKVYVTGKYNSFDVMYENYTFTGESYKNQTELESFFEEPDRIYDFDIDKLSEYIQDSITYEKKFSGKATVSIYRGRCVITEVYIGDRRVLELK